MKILRAKMSAGLLHTLGLRARVLLFLVMLPVLFYLLLTNLIYVRSHGMFNSIPGFCTLYRRYRFPAMIPMCRSRRPDSLVLANYWLWIRVVAYHYLHRPLVESLAPPSPRAH
jgi:hypothetical protein